MKYIYVVIAWILIQIIKGYLAVGKLPEWRVKELNEIVAEYNRKLAHR